MVHQLSLVSSIPHSKYLQTISSLQAITGIIKPTEISTYSLITQPSLIFKPKFEPGKINQIEQYFMKCTTTWTKNEFDISKPLNDSKEDIIVQKLFNNDEDSTERVWTLQISDIPIAGKNQQCSQQTIFESTLIHTHIGVDEKDATNEVQKEESVKKEPANNDKNNEDSDIMEIDPEEVKEESNTNPTTTKQQDSFLIYLSNLGYEVINQYWIKGTKFFIMEDIIIEIYKIFIRDDSYIGNGIKLKLLDESNTFQIKVYINIKNSTDIENINLGIKKLINLQNLIKSLFILEVPDRMYMDSRIKLNI
ncbi:SRB5 [Candida jiufengensis]|uniref:SRB5 n=1 Tax=Candida jiufengensis TaxID=497108 RepID=UPI002224E8A1|nr:SRB5 [Candida jiufengensis]KAI5952301.1 SRB5 [Candida jiufengensis]